MQRLTGSGKSRQIRAWLNWISLALAVLVAIVTVKRPEWMRAGFSYLTYYLLWLLVGYSAVTFVRDVLEDAPTLRDVWKKSRAAIGIAALIAVLVMVSTPVRFRVISDETNTISVSRSLLYEHRADNVTEGRWYYGNFWPLTRETDWHPPLFAFLVHLAHLVSGYRPANAFVANGFVLWGLFTLIALVIQRSLGRAWAGVALLLIAAQPLVCLCAASGIVDPLNTLLLGLSGLGLHRFLSAPSATRFRTLWCGLLLLVHARQESFLVFVVTVAGLTAARVIRREWLTTSVIYPLTPWILLPRVWQHVLSGGSPEGLQRGALSLFGLSHVREQIPRLIASLFDVHLVLPYAALINGLGVAALLACLASWWARRSRGRLTPLSARWTWPLILLNVGVWLGIMLAYHMADADHPTAARLFLPLVVMLSVAAVFALRWCVRRARRPAVLGTLVAMGLFALYHPIAMEDRFANTLFVARGYAAILDFLTRQPEPHPFLITNRPGQFVVHHYGAVSFSRANDPAFTEELVRSVQNHLFTAMFVVQEIQYDSQEPTADTQLTDRFALDPVFELQQTDSTFFRVSRVTGVR